MKLATYTHRGAPSYGAVTTNGIVDLGKRLGGKYPSLIALLEKGALDEARRTIEGGRGSPDRFNVSGFETTPRRSQAEHA